MTATQEPTWHPAVEPRPQDLQNPARVLPRGGHRLTAGPSTTGPQIARRLAWVKLPQDEYPGFEIRLWVNPPKRFLDDVPEEERIVTLCKTVYVEHNGWRDYEGNEYPPPTTQEFWDAIPTELAAVLFSLFQEAIFALPNSMAPGSRR